MVTINPNFNVLLMLWTGSSSLPLAAGRKSIVFRQQHGDEATADEVFSSFDNNVRLMLSFQVFYKDFIGLEGALGQPSEQSGKQSVSQEFTKTTQ